MRTSLRMLTLVLAMGVVAGSAAAQGSRANIVETAQAAGNFETLLAAAEAAGLVDALSGNEPVTVLAPTDAAFAQLGERTINELLRPRNRDRLVAILTYHVIPGRVPAAQVQNLRVAGTLNGQQLTITASNGQLNVDEATVVQADIDARNGIIHVIDRVLLPVEETIPEIASNADQFSTLVAALKAADLVDVLDGDGPFTVFAPTDEAFAALPDGTVEDLLRPENRDQLVNILTYHVVAGRVFARDVLANGSADALNNQTLRFGVNDGRLEVNGVTFVATDLDAANGVIHVIDQVLLPPTTMRSAVGNSADLIIAAIDRGVPLFNSGQPAACAAVYATAIEGLLLADDGLTVDNRRDLTRALRNAERDSDRTEAAWTLRRALDRTLESLQGVSRSHSRRH